MFFALQAVAETTTAVLTPMGLDNPIATGGTAIFAAIFVQYLKNSGWASWFTRETTKANIALSAVIALGLSVGIHVTSDPVNYAIIINRHELYQWAIQFASQHAAYKSFVVPAETLGEIRALLARVLTPPPVSEGDAKAGH